MTLTDLRSAMAQVVPRFHILEIGFFAIMIVAMSLAG